MKKRLGNFLVALAVLVAPSAAQGCRIIFYEEEPKNYAEFLKKIQEENRK